MAGQPIASPNASVDQKYVEVLEPGQDAAPASAGLDGAIRTATRVRVLFDSGFIPGGAAIDTGVLNTRGFNFVSVSVYNADAVVARAGVVRQLLEDGVNEIVSGGVTFVNAAAPSNNVLTFGPVPGGTTYTQAVITPFMRFVYAAGGTSNGRVVVWGR